MKNIVYIIISTVVVLIIVQMVVELYKSNYDAVYKTSTVNNQTGNLSANSMLKSGDIYTGTELLEFVRYNEKSDIIIKIDFHGSETMTITNNADRPNKYAEAIEKIKVGLYTIGTDEKGYLDADYDVISMGNTSCEFKLKS